MGTPEVPFHTFQFLQHFQALWDRWAMTCKQNLTPFLNRNFPCSFLSQVSVFISLTAAALHKWFLGSFPMPLFLCTLSQTLPFLGLRSPFKCSDHVPASIALKAEIRKWQQNLRCCSQPLHAPETAVRRGWVTAEIRLQEYLKKSSLFSHPFCPYCSAIVLEVQLSQKKGGRTLLIILGDTREVAIIFWAVPWDNIIMQSLDTPYVYFKFQ